MAVNPVTLTIKINYHISTFLSVHHLKFNILPCSPKAYGCLIIQDTFALSILMTRNLNGSNIAQKPLVQAARLLSGQRHLLQSLATWVWAPGSLMVEGGTQLLPVVVLPQHAHTHRHTQIWTPNCKAPCTQYVKMDQSNIETHWGKHQMLPFHLFAGLWWNRLDSNSCATRFSLRSAVLLPIVFPQSKSHISGIF